ncbi:peptidoglycan DD-metalloendopeptidase family protein [Halobacillus sp. K22]|uniref:peptidoglycan DD-metalloendopeptidase family protein n=1 Tax=Halobacillus sp. K22 TaxID=3457431 RepID=UPI003FCE9BF1
MVRKDIEHVRKNISERKKKKVQGSHTLPNKPFVPPQDEEMHGYPPLVTNNDYERKQPIPEFRKGTSRLGLQLFFAVLLFAAVAIGKQTDIAFLNGPEEWVTSQLQEDFPFAKVTAWYSERFGEPLQVVAPKKSSTQEGIAMPVNGTVTTSFQNDGKGIVLTTANNSEVKAVREGTVIFAGNDKDTQKTVIVQHEDGSKSIYGYLSSIDVHLYEHVQAQRNVGSVKSEDGESAEFFFAIEKDEQYLDPVEAIKVDESS